MKSLTKVVIQGEQLTLEEVVQVARRRMPIEISDDPEIVGRIDASYRYLHEAVASGKPVYGVTTGVGANATQVVPRDAVNAMQNNLPWLLHTGAGKRLPDAAVRAGMLLRINSLARGVSGVRMKLLQRLVQFLNHHITPHVFEFGSIGASGDLVPLSYIAGCIAGTDTSFRVDVEEVECDAIAALKQLGLEPLPLQAKEGLALVNGTAVTTGIAALCIDDVRTLLNVSLGAHALAFLALCGTEQALDPFIQEQKPFRGQIYAAEAMRTLIDGSQMTREGMSGRFPGNEPELIQDRYSLRCLPQYMAPIFDGMDYIAGQVEQEINSANDNPLLDLEAGAMLNGGNFLGQSVGIAMDQLRTYVGLTAKHLDVQVALMMSPEFSNGLPMSLSGNPERAVNMGLKGIQLLGNSIMPTLTFLGSPITDRFPTHAEQFNQNVNSQSFASANLARQSVETFQHYLAVPLIAGVQAVDLRTRALAGHYDARELLGSALVDLYEAVYQAVGLTPSSTSPFIPSDDDRPLDEDIARIVSDLAEEGRISQAIGARLGRVQP
ncbi:MAG: aromatic amino acid ammonia-lyase [Acidobacteriota bacterium]